MIGVCPANELAATSHKENEAKDWFVVITKSRCEKKVHSQLIQSGYNSFLPLEEKYRTWSDRQKKMLFPLIPSVVFVEDPSVNKENIYSIQGFHQILRFNGTIGIVTPKEIEKIKILILNELAFKKTMIDQFKSGDEVEIISGPFCGNFARAVEELNSYRVLIEVQSLGIGYQIDIPKNKIRKIR